MSIARALSRPMTRLVVAAGACGLTLIGGLVAAAYFSGSSAAETNTFTAAAVDHITINPSSATIPSGTGQSFTTTALDVSNSSFGDVTSLSTFTITPDGSCTGNTCTPGASGTHTVTAHFWGLTATATLTSNAADGTGTLTTPTANVSAGSTGNTVTFTYTAATGGLSNGAVTLVVPSGWSAPSTTGSAAGFTTASAGTVGTSGQTITVSGVTLPGGGSFSVVYGSKASAGPGAVATSSTGAQTWQAQERSTGGGTLTNLASSPSITVNAADGTGTLTTPTTSVLAGSSGNTITFTYTAATGGLSNGTVTLLVPSGWSAPSTTGSAAGFTTASTGTVGTSGQTITVSGVTLAGGGSFSVVYG